MGRLSSGDLPENLIDLVWNGCYLGDLPLVLAISAISAIHLLAVLLFRCSKGFIFDAYMSPENKCVNK